MFLSIYGSPLLQAAVGVDPADKSAKRRAAKSPLDRALIERRIAELRGRIGAGGLREAVVRAMLYVGMARGSVDERGLEAVRRIRLVDEATARLTLPEFKAMVREQYFMLLIDQDAALAALPNLVPPDPETRGKAFAVLNQILTARGELTDESARRMQQIAGLFGVEADGSPAAKVTSLAASKKSERAKAS
jgi:hypothetical protein